MSKAQSIALWTINAALALMNVSIIASVVIRNA